MFQSPGQLLKGMETAVLRELASELLALTKMNVNNAAFSDGVPIHISLFKAGRGCSERSRTKK